MASRESLGRSAIWLTLAGGIEFGLQLAIPIIFVRYLDATAFGQYRLLWLLAGTALAFAPAFMPQALFYFLPRAAPGQQRLIIGNVLAYLVAAGCVVGAVVSGWNPMLPEIVKSLFLHTHGISALFLGTWVLASVMNVLPTAQGRSHWQSTSSIGLAVFRTLLLAGAAVLTSNIVWVVAAMLVEAMARIMLLAYYLRTHRDEGKISWQMATMKKQLIYSLPFAFGNALFLLRVQADQWVVASMLPPALFATFSIGAVFLPVASLIRQPVNNAMLPRLNSAHASGDFAEISRLITKSNGASALLLVPIAGGLFATASELTQIIYTGKYLQAAPIMQVYLVGMVMSAFAVGHVLPALDQGRFAAINNACCLVLSVLFSIVGVRYLGLIGAALGSVLTLAISEVWSISVVARTLGLHMRQLLSFSAVWPSALGTFSGLMGVSFVAQSLSANVFLMLLIKTLTFGGLFVCFFLLAGGRMQLLLLIKKK